MSNGYSPLRKYSELSGKTFLVCVGAMKCATSWLHDYFGILPGVTVSPLKELHFFNTKFPANALGDMDLLALKRLGFHMEHSGGKAENLRCRPSFQASVDRVQMIYDDDAYFGHFARLCNGETRAFCDITPAYSVIGSSGFDYMRQFFETQDIALKLLFIMRDPIDRLWSQLRYMQQINPENDALTKWPDAIRSPRVCARANYKATVGDLDYTFPADDILYLFYEDLFNEASLRQICEFAGIRYLPPDSVETSNRTIIKLGLPENARAAFARLLAPQYEFCRERFGDAVPVVWST